MNNNNKKPTNREIVRDALGDCEYKYDSQMGFILEDNTTDNFSLMATNIINRLEEIQSPHIPCHNRIILELEGLQNTLQKKYSADCKLKLKYNPSAIDTSEEIMRLIAGNNYNPIYPSIIKQVIYCVKNKMRVKAVCSPIFAIFYGGAGIGKTKFIKSFVKPIPLHKYASIRSGEHLVNTESHVPMFHDNYIIHLDELSGLSKADIGKLKGLDATHSHYRPMRTNSTKCGFNAATLIGATNTAVKNVLISTDDNRKWVQVNFYDPPVDNREPFIQGVITKIVDFDYVNLWQSVNEDGSEPFSDPTTYTLYKQYVKEVCSSTTPTTTFIDDYLIAHADTWISKKDLYKIFKDEVDTKLNPMRSDLFFEICEKRGFIFRRQSHNGTYGYDIPAIKKEEEF